MQPSYSERIDAARRRLRAALGPQNDQERAALSHLERCLGDLPTAETLAILAERAVNAARADGYDRGWSEAGGRR